MRSAIAQKKFLVGLIGAGIQRSLSPAMHEEEASQHGHQLHYQLLDLDHCEDGAAALPRLLCAAQGVGFSGLNITFPCKQAVLPLLDTLSNEAQAIGAVNTVVFRDGRTIGHNTDASGFAWAMRHYLPRADLAHVVLLGAGGAGAAVADALMHLGVRQLCVVDRDAGRAAQLTQRVNSNHAGERAHASGDLASALRRATGLVHATPTGMEKMPGSAVSIDLLRAEMWVAEIVYFPIETQLLRAARERGCVTLDGGAMAAGQAAGAFDLFTGLRANAQRMHAHLRRLLGE